MEESQTVQTEGEGTSVPGTEVPGPTKDAVDTMTLEEQKAIVAFCRIHRKAQQEKEELAKTIKTHSSASKLALRDLLAELEGSGQDVIYRLPMPLVTPDVQEDPKEALTVKGGKKRGRTDSGERFIRVKTKNSFKTITPVVISAGITSASAELLQKEAEKLLKKKKKEASKAFPVKEVLVNCFMVAIKDSRSTSKRVLDVFSALPKGVESCDIADTPGSISELWKTSDSSKRDAKRIRTEYREKSKPMDVELKSVESHVSSFLTKNNRDKFRLNVSVDNERVPYYIRKRISQVKPPVLVKQLSSYVSEAVDEYLSKASEDKKAGLKVLIEDLPLIATQVSDAVLLRMNSVEPCVKERLMLHKGRQAKVEGGKSSDSESESDSGDALECENSDESEDE